MSPSRNALFIIMLCAAALLACSDKNPPEPSPSIQAATWRLSTAWPRDLPLLHDNAQRFADDVRTMSNGRIAIQVDAANQPIPPAKIFDAVAQGRAQLGFGSAAYTAGKIPAAQFFASIPFGLDAAGTHAWLYAGGGLALWRELYARHNLIPFAMGNRGAQMGGVFQRKIASVADLKGLKMRITGLGATAFAQVGGVPMLVSDAETSRALNGLIDAAEGDGPLHDAQTGLLRAARYYYAPGWQAPSAQFELLINAQTWNTLPPDLRAIVEHAATSAGTRITAEFETKNAATLQALRGQSAPQLFNFPPDVLHELHRHVDALLQQHAAHDADFKKVYDSYRAFQSEHRAWSALITTH